MVQLLEGFTPFKEDDADKYNREGWWPGLTFGDILDRAAKKYPDDIAFIDTTHRLSYAQTRDMANKVAIALMNMGLSYGRLGQFPIPAAHLKASVGVAGAHLSFE